MNLSFGGEEWDDTELVKAYDKAVKTWRKTKQSDKENSETSGPGPWTSIDSTSNELELSTSTPINAELAVDAGSWVLGSPCRAVWSNDGLEYEAKIIGIESSQCTIRFVGYGNQEAKHLNELKETFGKRSRDRQRRDAMAGNFVNRETLGVDGGYLSSVSLTSSMYNNCPSIFNGREEDQQPITTDFSVPGTQRESVSSSSGMNQHSKAKSPGKRKRDDVTDTMSIDGTQDSEAAQLDVEDPAEVLPSGAEATMGSSSSSDISEDEDGDDEATSAGGAFAEKLKDFSTMMPKFPVPPMPMSLANEHGKFDFGRGQLPSLLLSWYMSGYHAGYFDAQNQKSSGTTSSSAKSSRTKDDIKPRNKRQ